MKTDPLQSKIFKHAVNFFEKNKIPFWIDGGTLLGLVRDGKSIPWHKNINISIPGDQFDRLMSCNRKLLPFYRLRTMTDRSCRQWIDNPFQRVKILKLWKSHRKAGLKILVTPKYKSDDKYKWVDKRSCKWVSANHFDQLDTIDFEGKTYPIPSAAEKYLSARYGDWKKTEKYWISSIHDQSIVEDEIITKCPKKKRLRRPKTKRVELQGRYLKRMKKKMFQVIDVLDKNNIPYWLDEGTLLGVIRDGDLIPWDNDVDMSIPGEYADKVWEIRKQFSPTFYVKRVMVSNIWLPSRYRSIKLKTPFERLLRINFHIDLFCKHKVGDKRHWIIKNALKHSDSKYFDTQDIIEWEGRKIRVPSYVEEYLAVNYGEDWRVPNPDFDTSIDNKTIAERGF